jgi:hypothetical protein
MEVLLQQIGRRREVVVEFVVALYLRAPLARRSWRRMLLAT